ncbi:sigma-54 dependent transcriptional regulator [Rhizobiaceae bacterium BDR2-2]|uniref:DNA-binding transcriptional regulator NtrC n=1 Tax=Ectorhizobium quercum TaxID=2965071 RepID=A0AAE3SU91_9HYPH|nr:sigma-54 dependent transcriptional regulator [Ectorhizobium quercum]MCX8996817.1 sigma-54 dependent transcriptional regulator [Ectorhizobium quercum]
MTAQILIVDDDPVQRRLLKAAVERDGHHSHMAENGRQGLEILKAHAGIDVVVLDLMMPEMDGLAFLDALAVMHIDVPVIVQTGQGGIETVVNAMRAGAFDFVVKPVSPERLGTAIANALKLGHEQGEARSRGSRGRRSGTVSFSDIASASPDMIRVIDLGRRAAQSTIPVMLEGESGVGKEMVARAIQSASERSGKPFVTVNCGAIPENLVESILFGHEKGAFTGATEKHAGKFMEADGGTLFLDEVGDLPLDIQVKLLRAVQQGEIETVGSSRVQKVNVRLISATNKNLIEEVKAGRFREDLYYRLNVFPITIPALRRRKEDIPNLVRVFLHRFSTEQRLGAPLTISAGAMALLTAFDWPGNIRQLENTIYRAVVLAQGSELTETDFPQILGQLPDFAAGSAVRREIGEKHLRLVESLTAPVESLAAEEGPSREDMIASVDDSGEIRKLAEVEEELIRFALKFYGGQMSRVARRLGIGRSTLYRKLKDYGIDPDNPVQSVA